MRWPLVLESHPTFFYVMRCSRQDRWADKVDQDQEWMIRAEGSFSQGASGMKKMYLLALFHVILQMYSTALIHLVKGSEAYALNDR